LRTVRAALLALATVTMAQAQPVALPPPDGVGSAGLSHTAWQLVAISAGDGPGPATAVAEPRRYTLFLGGDGIARLRLDCNRGTAPWRETDDTGPDGGGLAFGPLASTDMACSPPSLAERLTTGLAAVRGYRLRGGRLVLLTAAGESSEWEPGEGPAEAPPLDPPR